MPSDPYKVAALCCAAAIGDLQKLKEILGSNKELAKAGDYDQRSALHVAASEGRKSCVELLVSHGANVNASDRWGGTPLQDAVREGHDDIVELLKKAGAKVADMGGFIDDFLRAAAAGDVPMMRRMLDAGMDVNNGDYDKRTALHLAASEGQLQAVELLLENGANVNAKDRFGGTPLLDAIRHKHDVVGHILKEKGATVEQSASISSALLTAVGSGDFDAVARLIGSGAPADSADYDKRSALHIAASEGNKRIVEYLVSRGAAVNIEDRWGGTPLGDAIRHNHDEIGVYLKSQGAKLGDKESNLAASQPTRKFQRSNTSSNLSADALLQMDERALIKHIIESYGQPKEHTKALNALHKKLEKDDKQHSKKKLCAKDDCILLILSLLRDHPGDNDLAKQAFAALGKLGEVDEHAAQICAQGGVDVCLHGLHHDVHDLETKLHAAVVLSNITFPNAEGVDEVTNAFTRSRGIASTVDALRQYQANTKLVQRLATILWNVCSVDPSNLERSANESAMVALCHGWKTHMRHGGAVEALAGAVSTLVTDPKQKVVFADGSHGTGLCLTSLKLHNENRDICAIVSKVLVDLTNRTQGGPNPKKHVGKVINKERKSIRDIVNAMKNHPDDLQIQEHCAHILSTAVRVTERPEYTIHAIKKVGGEAVLRNAHKKFPKSETLDQLHTDLKDLDKCLIC